MRAGEFFVCAEWKYGPRRTLTASEYVGSTRTLNGAWRKARAYHRANPTHTVHLYWAKDHMGSLEPEERS